MKRNLCCILPAALILTGCNSFRGYDQIPAPAAEKSSIQPVGNWDTDNNYEGIAATKEPTLLSFTSANGLCRMDVKQSYYDVTLDLSSGDHYAAGAAYSELLMQLSEKTAKDFEKQTEDYIYESLATVYSSDDSLQRIGIKKEEKPQLIQERVRKLKSLLPEKYRQELNGFASGFHGGDSGFVQDGKLSQDEVDLISLVPDVLRETACSAISLDGSRTASGKRLTGRLLEWDLGKGNRMSEAHCVLHFQDGDHSVTSVCSVGQLDVITGINTHGVFAGDLDVGSKNEAFSLNDESLSYTFSLREALETCKSARELGEYMNRLAPRFTYNHNLIITDEAEALVAENSHTETDGKPLLRDQNTALLDGLNWNAKGCICAVNSFAAQGQYDAMTTTRSNVVRWVKYDRLFAEEKEPISLARFKALMTAEKTDSAYHDIRSNGLVFLVIVDYDSHTLQTAFTGKDGIVDKPGFLEISEFGT